MSPMSSCLLRLLPVAALCAALSACSYKPAFINEYKIDIQQGNVLRQDMVAQLKPGQTKDQVRFLLGTPLVTDIFHQQRWDYVYHFKSGKTGEIESRRLTLLFDADNRLQRVEGDVTAAGEDDLTMSGPRTRVVDLGSLPADAALPESDGPGFFSRLWQKIGF